MLVQPIFLFHNLVVTIKQKHARSRIDVPRLSNIDFVEIVVPSSANAAALELVLYNGASGKMYKSLSLADERAFKVTTVDSGFSIYTAFVPLQNGPADGITLIACPDGINRQVIQFLSYDGVLKAINGPAKGSESVDIKVRETAKSSTLDSVGLTGRIRGVQVEKICRQCITWQAKHRTEPVGSIETC
ncbi:hypothetical protein ACLOJK_036866 [Asimina triloba]